MARLIATILKAFLSMELVLALSVPIQSILQPAHHIEPGLLVFVCVFSVIWVVPYAIVAPLILSMLKKCRALLYPAVVLLPVLWYVALDQGGMRYMKPYWDLLYLIPGSVATFLLIVIGDRRRGDSVVDDNGDSRAL